MKCNQCGEEVQSRTSYADERQLYECNNCNQVTEIYKDGSIKYYKNFIDYMKQIAIEVEEINKKKLLNKNNCELEKQDFIKKDDNKRMLSLIEPEFILGLGDVITFGAKKYAPNNWKKAEEKDLMRIKDALLRHIYAYLNGEKRDRETNISHLHHAACNLMFLDFFDKEQ